MTANEDSKGVVDHPTTDENKWFSYAVTLAIFTAVAAACSAVWVFSEPDPETRSRLASTLVPFGTIMIAAVTFCTVAWRGLVGSRQADQQKRQNDASDDANFAKLLQEGAKLIADDKTPNQIAGVASLDILLTEPRARYASQARDVLAESLRKIIVSEMITRHPREWLNDSVYASISRSLSREAYERRFSSVELSVDFDAETSQFTYWPIFVGFQNCRITGGSLMRADELENFNANMLLKKVSVVASTCDVTNYRYRECTFKGCKIVALDDQDSYLGKSNTYSRCDFSGCKFGDEVEFAAMKKFKFDECWFDVQAPPENISPEICQYIPPRLRVGSAWKDLDDVDLSATDITDEQRAAVARFHEWKNGEARNIHRTPPRVKVSLK